jgi:hypothetical protein|tara:strand:+ start:886 stop:1347 length:462 start_codon:yes stop_codon:yes gene_type:complete
MSGNNSLMDWRNSFSLVNNNLNCKSGQTFRGAHSSVQMPSGKNKCDTGNGGAAKPGPTTDTSSRIARIKKIQTRTRGNTGKQSIGGTSRGAHATVENASSGTDAKSRRAQLFGDYTSPAGQTSGRGGSSSDVIYFKNVFDRISLNHPGASGIN